MKKNVAAVIIAFLLLFLTNMTFAEKSVWLESFSKARELAMEHNKIILANFTGSDWCQYCIMAEKEIFAKSEFERYANENLILLKLDFPRKKALSSDIVKQNERLAEEYNIKGFPAHLFLMPDGEVIGKTGYIPGGADNWLKVCKDIIENRPSRTAVTISGDFEKAIKSAYDKKLNTLVIFKDADNSQDNAIYDRLKKCEDFATLYNWKVNAVLVNKQDYNGNKFADLQIPKTKVMAKGVRCFLINPKQNKLILESELTQSNISSFVREMALAQHFDCDGDWLKDYNKAMFLAKIRNKPLLMSFTGKDWCRWCVKMEEDVFEKAEFKNFAKDNMVLLELDFPMKEKLDPKLTQQNEWLSRVFDVKGFPTLVVLDDKGTELARGSYTSDTKAFLKELENLVEYCH